jgi:hypothetical protein
MKLSVRGSTESIGDTVRGFTQSITDITRDFTQGRLSRKEKEDAALDSLHLTNPGLPETLRFLQSLASPKVQLCWLQRWLQPMFSRPSLLAHPITMLPMTA